MATNEVPRGPIGRYVIENVTRLREDHNWSFPRLSQELEKVGRPILPTGLHRLENGKRRVDADDLVALALAFNVSPLTLLLPWVESGSVALTEKVTADAKAAWSWAQGLEPLESPEDWDEAQYASLQFHLNAVPRGFRLGKVRPGTSEWDEAKGRQGDGQHQEAP